MRKNLSVVASILLVIGGFALWWVLAERKKDSDQAAHYESQCAAGTDEHVRQYNEWLQTPPQERPELPLLLDAGGKTKTREQLWQEQQVRLKADLDRLAAGEITAPPSFTDVLYGENWQVELSEYKKRKERQASVFTGSLVCISMGGLIHAWWLLLRTGRLAVKVASDLKRSFGRRDGTAEQSDQAAPEPADAEDVPPEPESDEPQGRPARLASISVNPVTPSGGEPERRCMGSVTQRRETARARERVIELALDEKSSDAETSTAATTKCQVVREQSKPLDGKNNGESEKTTEVTPDDKPGDAGTPAAAATECLAEQSKPIDNTLTDLTQQVSAIREYAAHQQDRLEKLQDGYDWNIIRTFCLRVIRAVDNLESRIARFREDNIETTYLEEVRDELIFALESSGIEQFKPETDSEYRGQERLAEAVREKQNCDNPEQAGKIANVIRPGYQYFINEGNVKIVRPAQVRLYA
ncbi:MAG: nucleotide exchange factor GrpE [Planctomycetota bacterium]|jgi:molecular chaperone GrpE (heat shock protein)